MLRIYIVVLELIGRLRLVVDEVRRHDTALAKQMAEALASVALNTAEGAGNIAGHKRQRYQTALGSAREVKACLDTAQAFGYIADVDEVSADKLDHVTATLVVRVMGHTRRRAAEASQA
jgi:four helix bundle protein